MKENDNGFKSRKMLMAYASMVLMLLGYALTALSPGLSVVYGEYVMGILGAATIYSGSNSFVKWSSFRNNEKKVAVPPPEPPKND